MIDYYKILDLDMNCCNEKIHKSYKIHINRYCGLPFLTDKMKDEVKKLKKAIYILGSIEKREKYNALIKNKGRKTVRFQLNDYNNDFQENTKINERIFGDIF